MLARAVFGMSVIIAALSGTALFSKSRLSGTWLLDVVFLLALATCLALALLFLARRLRDEGAGVQDEPENHRSPPA